MNKELTPEETKKINTEFKKVFPKLNDSDLVLYKSSSNREKFLDIITQKQNIKKQDAEKRLKEIEATCGCSSASKAA